MAPVTDVLLAVSNSPRVSLAVQATTPVVSSTSTPRATLVLAALPRLALALEAKVEAL